MGSSSDASDAAQKDIPRRVFLVQAPLGQSFQNIVSALNLSTSTTVSAPTAIDWSSTNIDVIPTMKSHISFVRHFAVCLIDDHIWINPNYTLLDKFDKALFWDHPGASSGKEAQQRNSISWSKADIKQIDAIQEVGITRRKLCEIRENYYQGLFKDWSYLPLWWNCQDFAIRLAFLIVGAEARDISRWIIIQLGGLRAKEVTGKPDKVATAGFLAGWLGCAGFAIAECVIGVACPPAAILAAWGLGFGSGMTAFVLQSIGEVKFNAWRKRTLALETRFPDLRMIRLY